MGACDAAVHFAMRGYGAVVSLDPRFEAAAPGADHQHGEPRSGPGGVARRFALGSALAGLAARSLIFKKIDSTMRGNPGAEIAWAAEAFGCEAAIVTPAFPAMGRCVESGVLQAAGGASNPSIWRRTGAMGNCAVAGTSLRAAWRRRSPRRRGSSPRMPRRMATWMPSPRLDWLPSAASCGRGRQGWRRLWRGLRQPGPHEVAGRFERHAAVLFCIGSDHAVTVAQQRELSAVRRVAAVNAEAATPDCIRDAFRRGMHVALQIPYGRIAPERIRELMGDWRGPLALSGGATASLVCRALGVREIQLRREIAPGIPRGVIAGGLFDGAPVVTKSGGFGTPCALIQIADELTCPQSTNCPPSF